MLFMKVDRKVIQNNRSTPSPQFTFLCLASSSRRLHISLLTREDGRFYTQKANLLLDMEAKVDDVAVILLSYKKCLDRQEGCNNTCSCILSRNQISQNMLNFTSRSCVKHMAHIYSVKPARSYFIMLFHSNSICITINLFCFVSMIIVLNFLHLLDVRGHFWTVLISFRNQKNRFIKRPRKIHKFIS